MQSTRGNEGERRPVRAALYARVSTSGNGQDTGLQVDALRRLAEQRGWAVADVYVDEGVSGAVDSRPALDRMMGDARAGTLDVVAVWKFDRFARSTAHLLGALDEFRRCGVDFVSLTEAIDTGTAIGKMVYTLLAAVAEFERSLIQERVRAGVARAKENGKHIGRPRVEIDVRPAVALLEQGRGIKQVAKILNVPLSTLRRRLGEVGEWERGGRMLGSRPGGNHAGHDQPDEGH
jgi:DNA invertase Pin-like site-specific DNA recombinase